ncbi:cytochrome P450 [Thermoactinomyces sp. DSM 45892]|uniref:cytochrome P450 n=1 Tax=Thermoactinomyces sp. DSM 45892 TaxID=1882753 RepID=UPI00089A550D|nr:cytochrome P450 [Thermoactinomyces sp. DSM 45892]SDY79431.1 Cytochrome P450 [Thermoactinomyces sp. DSM 45892]
MEASLRKAILLHDIAKLKSKEEQWEPYAWYKEMREKSPVFYDPEQDVWNVFLYDHVKRVLFDHELFSSKRERSLIPIPRSDQDDRNNVNNCDPPQHRSRRALLSKAFTPRSLNEWKPRIQLLADELVAGLEDQTTVDIVQRLAVPLPIIVIADLLGVPSKDRELFKAWSNILFLPYAKDLFTDIAAKKAQAMKEFREYLHPIVLEKRRNPANDILSDLVQAELEGEKLTDEEVVMSGIGLLGAGNETTTTLISNTFYAMLFDKPDIYQELRKDVSLIPKLVEEALRFRFLVTMDRRVAQDTDIFGHEMKQGQMVVAWIASANRDESQFAHAGDFDIHRSGNQHHLTFGAGAHFCLGAPLARLEATMLFTSFVERFSNISPIDGMKVSDHLTDSVTGQSLKSLPIHIER